MAQAVNYDPVSNMNLISTQHNTTNSSPNKNFTVLLATVLIQVTNKWGYISLCRALLDSGSQLNFVTEHLAVQLGLKRKRTIFEISGIGGISTEVRQSISTTIKSRHTPFSTELQFHILPRISDRQPELDFDISDWNLPSNLSLADPAFNKSQRIDMLIGAEILSEISISETLRLGNQLPVLQNTELGWIVTGKFIAFKNSSFHCKAVTAHSTANLERIIQQFWETEAHTHSSKTHKTQTTEERLCELHFQSTVKKSENGRFIVRLPFRTSPTALGDSQTLAKRRLQTLEKRLSKNDDLRKQYRNFMSEYENLQHMTRIGDVSDVVPESGYFLPHHCVLKAESSTTKLRVVFDASAKTSTNLSLNDTLMVGPTVQSDLFTVITRFRSYNYVFAADISKMYRQIEVDPQDRKYQMILWRQNYSEPIGVYQLNTVTYGTSAAPYLATRCINKLAEDFGLTYPQAAAAVLKETYVDDIMTGANSLEAASSLLEDIRKMLSAAHFDLRKYCSNDYRLLSKIPDEYKEPYLQIGKNEVVKTLGLIWQPNDDTFVYHFEFELPQITTKRTVLSNLGKIFDPLGLIGPVVVLGKIFLQQLWKLKISWDECLDPDHERRWREYITQLQTLNDYRVPRHLLTKKVIKSIQIHSFSDSSENAYGACCYLRCLDENNAIASRLVCAKSRVAPANSLSIPKLELLAAVLMTELVERLLNTLPITVMERFYYTDSKIVLAWISKPSYTWTTFVANRTAKIQELTRPDEWSYVNTKENPADLISRGLMPNEFLKSSLWSSGPEFLQSSWQFSVPSKPQQIRENEIPERRPNKLVFLISKPAYTDITSTVVYGGSLRKLERILAYCIRFYNNINPSTTNRQFGPLEVSELDSALVKLILNSQRSYLFADYKSLLEKNSVEKSSSIRNLQPYLDDEGIIRVGGRLHHSNLPYNSKHPIILPKKCELTNLIVSYFHFKHMHAGAHTLNAIIRQTYWPLDGLHICRSIVHRCIRCFRTKPAKNDPLMGSLPKDRVTPGRAFLTTGIDFCGPVYIHSRIRGRAPTKAYLCIFVCFTTKAVHIETVSDLSTPAFIAALRRFIARRGLCKTIWSDNATNFLGAKNELMELKRLFETENHKAEILKLCQDDRIDWRTIPPRSPHFGGLWEAAVKQTKYHLIRVVANATLTFEEMTTLTVQIEAILNSRPLTPLSSDPNDLEALTPGHFLIGQPLTSFPEPDVTSINSSRLERFRRLQQLQQIFWKRWSKEYLHLLQQRHKWTSNNSNLKQNALVVVQDDNLPPYKWALARVLSTIPGHDGVHRVAEIKTQHGIYKRAITKLYPLPIED